MDKRISCGPAAAQGQKVNCYACGHFYITYNKAFPYGCVAMGFKSRSIPSREVYSNSGIECQSFVPKQARSL